MTRTHNGKMYEILHSNTGSPFLPNAFQMSNAYIDHLMFYLTPEEWKVLSYAIRAIFGWRDKIDSRQDRISLTQFVEGYENPVSGFSCYGCGLSRPAVCRAINGLCRYGVLGKVGDADARHGQMYRLPDNGIDWDGLEARVKARQSLAQERTQSARAQKGSCQQVETSDSLPVNGTYQSERLMGLTDSGKSDLPIAVSGTYSLYNSQRSVNTISAANNAADMPPTPPPPSISSSPAVLLSESVPTTQQALFGGETAIETQASSPLAGKPEHTNGSGKRNRSSHGKGTIPTPVLQPSTTTDIQATYERLLERPLGRGWANGESAAAKEIAQHWTPTQLEEAYRHYKDMPFWRDKRLRLSYLAEQMPEYFSGQNSHYGIDNTGRETREFIPQIVGR